MEHNNEYLLRWSQKMLTSIYIEFPHKYYKDMTPKQSRTITSMYYRELRMYCLSTSDKKRGINHDIDVVLQQCLHYLDSDAPEHVLKTLYDHLVDNINVLITCLDNNKQMSFDTDKKMEISECFTKTDSILHYGRRIRSRRLCIHGILDDGVLKVMDGCDIYKIIDKNHDMYDHFYQLHDPEYLEQKRSELDQQYAIQEEQEKNRIRVQNRMEEEERRRQNASTSQFRMST